MLATLDVALAVLLSAVHLGAGGALGIAGLTHVGSGVCWLTNIVGAWMRLAMPVERMPTAVPPLRQIMYWAATALSALSFTISGVLNLMHAPYVAAEGRTQ